MRNNRKYLWIVMAAAVLLSAALIGLNRQTEKEIAQLNADLEISRNAWQTTAAEKEALQATLTDLQGQLREAQTSQEEAETRAAELTEQISDLTATNAQLNEDLAAAQTARDEAQAAVDALLADAASATDIP